MRLGNYIILLFLTTIIFSIYPIVWHPCSDIVWGNSCFLNPIGGANVSEYLIVGNIFLVNNTSGDILAGTIKDIDNPAYYIDPSGNTKVNWLYVNYLGQNVNAYSNIIYGLKAVQFNPFASRPVGIGIGALWRRDDGRLIWVDGSSGSDEVLVYKSDIDQLNETINLYFEKRIFEDKVYRGHALLIWRNYLFVGGTDSRIHKYDILNDFNETETMTLGIGADWIGDMELIDDKIYAVTQNSNDDTLLAVVDPDNLTVLELVKYNKTDYAQPPALCYDGKYIYLTSGSSLYRVNPKNLSDYESILLGSFLHSCVYDPTIGKLYIANTQGYVYKVDANKFTLENSKQYYFGTSPLVISDDIAVTEKYLVLACEGSGQKVALIDKNTLDLVGFLEWTNESFGVFGDGKYSYILLNDGRIIQYSPEENKSIVLYKINVSKYYIPNELAFGSGNIFVTTWYTDAIVKPVPVFVLRKGDLNDKNIHLSKKIYISGEEVTTKEYVAKTYYNKSEVDSILTNYYNKSEVDIILSNYYNKSEVYNKTETDNLLTNLNNSVKGWVQTNYYDKVTIDSWNLIKNYVLQQDLNANGFEISGVSSLGMSGDVVFNVPNATIHATQGLNIHLDKNYQGTFALNIQKSNGTIVTSIDEGGNIRTTGYVASNGESYAKATFPLAEDTAYASHSESTSQLVMESSCSIYFLKNLYLPAGQLSKTINGLVLFAIEGYVDVDCAGSGNMTFVIETPTGNSYSSQTYSLSSTASRFYSRIDIPKSDIVDGLYIVKLRLCSSAASLTGSTCTTTTYGKVLSAYLIVR